MSGSEKKYRMASGAQVRQEDFGLLFYTMKGPRLYFLPVKTVLAPGFFSGEYSLLSWVENSDNKNRISDRYIKNLEKSLDQLIHKGVLLEC